MASPVEPTSPTGAPAASDAPGTTVGSRYDRWQYVHVCPSNVSSVKPMPQRGSGCVHERRTTDWAIA